MINGEVSYWWAQIGEPTPRPALTSEVGADVCIIGAGYTGLWTAYHLKREQPDLKVVILEREFAGFGASGRNGGWLTDRFAADNDTVAAIGGRSGALALRRALRESVREVLEACAREEISADIVSGGVLQVARGEAQARRLRAQWEAEQRWSEDSEGVVALDAAELGARIRIPDGRSGLYNPHGARVQPAKLAQGLAAAVIRLGVEIYERTPVLEVGPGFARAEGGTVRSPIVLTCLEGFESTLPGRRRRRLPLNSAMVVTAPLPASAWEQIGWEGAEVLGDFAHAYTYAQRTADGRIALGGRGVPYRFGSRIDNRGATQASTIRSLMATLHDQFPAAAEVPIDHAWCGVLGVARDWFPAVGLDRLSGLGGAGAYVGNGVGASHLAGRTLCDLVLGHDTERSSLPWVDHRTRRWEPEPLRWMGVQLVYALYREADRRERGGNGRTSSFARAAEFIAGR
ncbi:MAG: FAD-binding oxidoreductase [Solirubrobacteraceae bacterium]